MRLVRLVRLNEDHGSPDESIDYRHYKEIGRDLLSRVSQLGDPYATDYDDSKSSGYHMGYVKGDQYVVLYQLSRSGIWAVDYGYRGKVYVNQDVQYRDDGYQIILVIAGMISEGLSYKEISEGLSYKEIKKQFPEFEVW